jgi:hypothetical protein
MIIEDEPTVRLPRFSPQQRTVLAQLAEQRTRSDAPILATLTEYNRVREVRALAAEGRLAATVAVATPAWRNALSGAAFALAYPLVFARLTRRVEMARGHLACATSLSRMTPECVDRFYDDVEGVVVDLLEHARTPIRNIEAWMACRLNAATVDAHRRRRGEIGALQRPRLPRWLSDGLGGDVWLADLAVAILLWVGVRSTAGHELWPLDAWALRRMAIRGDSAGIDPRAVAHDVGTVLAVMRTHPAWYADYVERPLGHKQAPVAGADALDELSPLELGDRGETDEDYLSGLAARALDTIARRLSNAEDPTTAVPEVLRSVFGDPDGRHDIDRPPLTAPEYEERVATVLASPAATDRLIAAVRRELGIRRPEVN